MTEEKPLAEQQVTAEEQAQSARKQRMSFFQLWSEMFFCPLGDKFFLCHLLTKVSNKS